jgi:alpha-L-rhamnosidase
MTSAPALISWSRYSNWRFGEAIFTDGEGQPLNIEPTDFSLSAWVVHYPFDASRATSFSSGSPSSALDRVWALNQNSVKYLGLDMYSDSNARQRSDACQADSTTASQAQFATTAELAMPRYQMQMVMDFTHTPGDTDPDPSGTGGFVSAAWADWSVLPAINVVNDALFTGDLSLAPSYYDALVEWHLYRQMINGSGTLGAGLVIDNACGNESSKCLSCLIDTSGGSDDNFHQSRANSVVQAWVYYGLRQVARLGRWIGRSKSAAQLDATADVMKSAFNRLMVDAEQGVVCDGLCAETGHASLHASFYALAFDLVSASHRPRVFAYLKHRFHSSSVGFPGGSYPIQFFLIALYNMENDRGNLAYEVLTSDQKHSWIAMMRDHNATTTMECWSPDELPNLSFSHIWSASPAFVVPWYLGGVRPLAPGFTKVQIKPQPGPLKYFAMVVPTVRGPVRSNVSQNFDDDGALSHFKLVVVVPGNVQAVLYAPRRNGRSRCVVVNGQERRAAALSAQGAHVVVEVTSGAHTMEWCAT